MRQINRIVVHWTATPEAWMRGRSTDEQVAEIRRWHVEDNRWRDIGYHWIVGRDGVVVKGRDEAEQGAGVSGHNADTVHVCLIGGPGDEASERPEDHFTAAQLRAARDLIGERLMVHAGAEVVGHRDLAATLCPGFDVATWWAAEELDVERGWRLIQRGLRLIGMRPGAVDGIPGRRTQAAMTAALFGLRA